MSRAGGSVRLEAAPRTQEARVTTMIERPPGGPDAGPPSGRGRGVALPTGLPSGLPDDVDGVVAALERWQEVLERDHGVRDGLACFNRLYLRVTRDIRALLDDEEVCGKDFLARLDVEFARRYLRATGGGAAVPRAWAVLLDRRAEPGIDPVRFAVVGITAHVNLDLAPAVVRTCTVLGRSAPGPAERADYRAVNDTFARHLDTLLGQSGPRCDAVTDVPVVLAREVTWRQVLQLWEQRSRPTEYEREIDALDRRTALIGRGLLTLGALT